MSLGFHASTRLTYMFYNKPMSNITSPACSLFDAATGKEMMEPWSEVRCGFILLCRFQQRRG